jgi:hypothetical protein
MQANIAERQEHILSSLNKFDFLTTSQIQRLHNLGGRRNVCKVLASMSDYLNTNKSGKENVYSLNARGKDFLDIQKPTKNHSNLEHYLMRNEFFLYIARPSYWKPETKTTIGDVSLIADVLFKKENKFSFLEVDNEQKMINNRRKVEKYQALFQTKVFQKEYGYFPTLYWLTKYDSRKKKLLHVCQGLPVQVYTLDEIK